MQTLWSFSFCLGFKNLLLVYLELLIRKKDAWPLVVITRHKSGSLTRVGRKLLSWILLENLVLNWYTGLSPLWWLNTSCPKAMCPHSIIASQYRVLGSTKVFYSIVTKLSALPPSSPSVIPVLCRYPSPFTYLCFFHPSAFWLMEEVCSASPPFSACQWAQEGVT